MIDGPKDFRALKLALRLLRRHDPALVFVHDCPRDSKVRGFLERNVPHAFFADAAEFVQQYGHLDREESDVTRGLACIPPRIGCPDLALRCRLTVARLVDNLRRSTAKRLKATP